ncbi:MAG: NUDIX domain-containing protein [Verrucomicrobia bacterium]|nr:NUDIX domain-containing protein [Verrucomicrobiota bacterium]
MAEKPFVLSMKVVVRDDKGRCLLLRRSASSKAHGGKWDFPGGKVDPGEAFDQALLREVVEETGLVISLKRVAGSAESDLPLRKVAYLIMEGRVQSGTVRLSSEHDDCVWVEPEKLPAMDLCEQFLPFARSYASATTV